MKHSAKLLVSALLLGAGVANAAPPAHPVDPPPPEIVSIPLIGTSPAGIGAFTQYFTFTTPTSYADGSLSLIAGLSGNFESLSLSVGGVSYSDGTSAYFKDSLTSLVNLSGNQSYLLTVSGISKVASATYTLTGVGFAAGVPAVPESETYAMFLAGLGLLGAIARRRRGER